MMKSKSAHTEITLSKDKDTDIRCDNCGKKLLSITKNQGNTARNASFSLSVKCSRCGLLNCFDIK